MEGELTTEDGPSNPTRRRVLKASAALSATGVVGSGFVGSAAGGHEPCPRTGPASQCRAGISFNQGTVGDCSTGTHPDSVTVGSVNVTCEDGGFVDLHDKSTRTGPTGTFKAGYIVGVSDWLSQGTHTDVEICLFKNRDHMGTCTLEWNRNEWPNNSNSLACRSMSAMLHLDNPADRSFTHVCDHTGPSQNDDHAYLCDLDDDGDLEPIQAITEVCGDGAG